MKTRLTFQPSATISQCRIRVEEHLKVTGWANFGVPDNAFSRQEARALLARYTAGVAGEFQAWLGITYAFARNEDAQHALKDNLRCELGQDHIGMLYKFTGQVEAWPHQDHRRYIEGRIHRLRVLFGDVVNAGLAGLTVLAVLENTSQLFIPVLENAARGLGAKDFTYTNTHGEADAKHSEAFIKALDGEVGEGYENPESIVSDAAVITANYVTDIFSHTS